MHQPTLPKPTQASRTSHAYCLITGAFSRTTATATRGCNYTHTPYIRHSTTQHDTAQHSTQYWLLTCSAWTVAVHSKPPGFRNWCPNTTSADLLQISFRPACRPNPTHPSLLAPPCCTSSHDALLHNHHHNSCFLNQLCHITIALAQRGALLPEPTLQPCTAVCFGVKEHMSSPTFLQGDIVYFNRR